MEVSKWVFSGQLHIIPKSLLACPLSGCKHWSSSFPPSKLYVVLFKWFGLFDKVRYECKTCSSSVLQLTAECENSFIVGIHGLIFGSRAETDTPFCQALDFLGRACRCCCYCCWMHVTGPAGANLAGVTSDLSPALNTRQSVWSLLHFKCQLPRNWTWVGATLWWIWGISKIHWSVPSIVKT